MKTTTARDADGAALRRRVMTAVALAPWLPLAIWLHSDMLLLILLLPVLLLAADEWLTLGNPKPGRIMYLTIIGIVSLALVLWPRTPPVTILMKGLIGVGVLWWLFVPLLLWRNWWPTRQAMEAAMVLPVLLPTYAALVFLALPAERESAILFIYLLLLTWTADSVAWISGRLWGKHKLAPSISPAKTWEGFIGALIAVTVLSLATALWWLGWTIHATLILTLCGSLILVGGVYGDLLESRLKRSAGVKDSGALLPGHGGILDRIDSLTSTAPVFAACVWSGRLG